MQAAETAVEGVMKDLLTLAGFVAVGVFAVVCGFTTYELWPTPIAWVCALLTFVAGFTSAIPVIAYIFGR